MFCLIALLLFVCGHLSLTPSVRAVSPSLGDDSTNSSSAGPIVDSTGVAEFATPTFPSIASFQGETILSPVSDSTSSSSSSLSPSLSCHSSPSVSSCPSLSHSLSVTGTHSVSISTDLTQLSATITLRNVTSSTPLDENDPIDQDIAKAMFSSLQEEMSAQSNQVTQYLKLSLLTAGKPVVKYHTTAFTLEPLYQYIYNNNQNGVSTTVTRLEGYECGMSLFVQMKNDQSSKIIAALTDRGINRIDGISFVASDSKIEAAREKAIEGAVDDALKQANRAMKRVLEEEEKQEKKRNKNAKRCQIHAEGESVNDEGRPDDSPILQVEDMVVLGVSLPSPSALSYNNNYLVGGTIPGLSSMGWPELKGGEQQVSASVSVKLVY